MIVKRKPEGFLFVVKSPRGEGVVLPPLKSSGWEVLDARKKDSKRAGFAWRHRGS
jgi:hypothetical protein